MLPPEARSGQRLARQGKNGKRIRAMATLSVILGTAAAVACGALAGTSSDHGQAAAEKPAANTTLELPSSWKLEFNSNFTGNELDKSIWGTCYPWAPNGCTNFGNDNEKEWYQASQVQMKNGILHLIAQRAPTSGYNERGAQKEYACRSGMVTTDPGFHFMYGYVQVIARIPYGAGLWAALWLAAANRKWPPEIDILEHWASDADAKVYVHPKVGTWHGGAVNTPDISKGWHTFTLYWTKSRLAWDIDGRQVLTTTKGIPQQSMYLIANVADTNSRPGTCSGTMLIKSVKVWQPKS
jgi:beta-glucanase (GH16 family)